MIKIIETSVTVQMTLNDAVDLYMELGKLESGVMAHNPQLAKLYEVLRAHIADVE